MTKQICGLLFGHALGQRRRAHKRFGFALQSCVLRYSGRVLAPGELIPPRWCLRTWYARAEGLAQANIAGESPGIAFHPLRERPSQAVSRAPGTACRSSTAARPNAMEASSKTASTSG
ncbi:DUF4158 domain-containing protein [Aureimonas sp. OT7]|nr:DUF4158 domain-containing protein [Aureimonas sp. OT7]